MQASKQVLDRTAASLVITVDLRPTWCLAELYGAPVRVIAQMISVRWAALNAVLLYVQASKQVLDRMLPSPVSYADLCAIAGAVGVYNTHGPLINVGYGRRDVDGPDPFQGVGSNTNQQRDYPIQEIINEWGKLTLTPYEAFSICRRNLGDSTPFVTDNGSARLEHWWLFILSQTSSVTERHTRIVSHEASGPCNFC